MAGLKAGEYFGIMLQSMLRILSSHGIPATLLPGGFSCYCAGEVKYCSPAWCDYCSAADRGRLDVFLPRCKQMEDCEQDIPTITDGFRGADDTFLLVYFIIMFFGYFTRTFCQEMENCIVCGLGCPGRRRTIPLVPWMGPGVQSPVAIQCGAVWLGGAY